MTNEQKEKCAEIIVHYGVKKQRRQLCEECAELIQSAIKVDRLSEDGSLHMEAYSHFCEELADAIIMIEQIRLTVSENLVNSYIEQKLDRQMKRIEEENNEQIKRT
jgi:hypothetical protein